MYCSSTPTSNWRPTSLIRRAVEAAQQKDLECLTTNILCREGSLTDRMFYGANDFFQYLSCLHRPFSTGMFMMFATQKFRDLGGFDERVHFAEDYRLSSQVRAKQVQDRSRRRLYHQPASSENGPSARRLAVLVDRP